MPLAATTALIALNASRQISPPAICRLCQELDAWRDFAGGGPEQEALACRLGVPPAQLRRALKVLPRAAEIAERELAEAQRRQARLLTWLDDDYPPSLRELTLPPPVLYLRGRLPPGPAVAIVGSRKADDYGLEAAAYFARALAAAGVVIVSGFALGVDTAAHRGALEAPAGRTVAVLGCGLDVPYPPRNAGLGERLIEDGALVSEFPWRLQPRPWSFPIRNRLIAALSQGTLVVQAAARSGSLITAHHALDLGREVYAVPGSIFESGSLGTHALIRDGAQLVQHPQDILDDFGPAHVAPGQNLPLFAAEGPTPADAEETELSHGPRPSGLAGKLLDHLPRGKSRDVDELAALLGVGVHQLLGELLELELGGWIERLPGPAYRRR